MDLSLGIIYGVCLLFSLIVMSGMYLFRNTINTSTGLQIELLLFMLLGVSNVGIILIGLVLFYKYSALYLLLCSPPFLFYFLSIKYNFMFGDINGN